VIPSCTGSSARPIPGPAQPGASTPCMTGPTDNLIPSRRSPTPSAPWNSRTIVLSTIGS